MSCYCGDSDCPKCSPSARDRMVRDAYGQSPHIGIGGYVQPPPPVVVRQGWECPKCGSVYAPSMPMCTRCGPKRDAVESERNER